MLYAPPIDRPPALHSVASILAATRDERTAKEDRFDVTMRLILSPLQIGQRAYPLRSLLGAYPGRVGADGEFVVPELFPDFVGRGQNINDAFLDWRNQIHSHFKTSMPSVRSRSLSRRRRRGSSLKAKST